MGKDRRRDAHRANFATLLGADVFAAARRGAARAAAVGRSAPLGRRGRGARRSRARRARAPRRERGVRPGRLEEARRRLRELGYLDGRVERFVFRRAFEGRGAAVPAGRPRRRLRGWRWPARRPSSPRRPASARPPAVAALLAAPLPGAILAAGGAGAGARPRGDSSRTGPGPGRARRRAVLAARRRSSRSGSAASTSLRARPAARALLWGVPVAAAALLAAGAPARASRRAYAHSRVLPSRRRSRNALRSSAALLVMAGAAALLGVRAGRRCRAARPGPRRDRLRRRGRGGRLRSRTGRTRGRAADRRRSSARGATGWWPAAPASPPEIWTSLATGEPPERHGVRALERVRPLGSRRALRGARSAWPGICAASGRALGLVASAPVSASDRRRLAFWEVASSAGLPVGGRGLVGVRAVAGRGGGRQ